MVFVRSTGGCAQSPTDASNPTILGRAPRRFQILQNAHIFLRWLECASERPSDPAHEARRLQRERDAAVRCGALGAAHTQITLRNSRRMLPSSRNAIT